MAAVHLGATATNPAHAPAAEPLAVVSPQFCVPHTLPLTVKKTVMSFSHGDFTVTDSNGAVVLQVEGAVFSFRNRRLIRDAAGQPLLTLQAKLYSLHDRWEVFRGDSTNASDLLFTVKRSSLWQLKREMDVFLAGNTVQQVCDFKMKGTYFKSSCAFYLGNSDVMIAQMNRKHTLSSVMLGNEFCVDVFPQVDYAFIVALVVILEDVNRPRQQSRK